MAHRQIKDKRYADRLKTVYLPGKGWSVTQVAKSLMIDRETVRNHYKRYRKGGLSALQKFEADGSESFLNELEKQALDQHLHKNLYLTAKEITHYIEQTWGVSYSESGITQLLYRMGYVYKKPKWYRARLMPGNNVPLCNAMKHSKQIKRSKILFISWMPLIPITIR
ncbi:helix-turn-helix domain-containing protein [Nitrosomonas communis]|uniref:helix-turn-helix domain-containing protein n=1 Tax=Nitrosomonas communis TaxID=44574 RepID=UPI000A8B9B2A|nr:winged helix-turn-helix domain-containing protein [Nitrosomonas communis]